MPQLQSLLTKTIDGANAAALDTAIAAFVRTVGQSATLVSVELFVNSTSGVYTALIAYYA